MARICGNGLAKRAGSLYPGIGCDGAGAVCGEQRRERRGMSEGAERGRVGAANCFERGTGGE